MPAQTPRAGKLLPFRLDLPPGLGEQPWIDAPTIPPERPRPRKLVLNLGPFDATGVNPERRYLVQGFRSELAACLVRFREWSVRDQAAGAGPEPSRDGQYRVDASTFETKEGLRLVLMLRDLGTGEYVWSERLVLSVADWFDTQQAVVRRLATALNINLSAERLATQSQVPDPLLSIYDLWLKAQALHYSRDYECINQAQQIYRRLIRERPDFAPAYIGIANYCNIVHITHPGTMRHPTRTAEALMFAREAIRLDPTNAKAQLCLAWTHAMAGQPSEAHLCAMLAYELNENDAWTRVSSLNCRAMAGLTSDMLPLIKELTTSNQLLTPLQWAYHATTLFIAGDFEGTISAGEKAGDSDPLTAAWKAAALVRIGRMDDARVSMSRFITNVRAKWIGANQCDDAAIGTWFLQANPLLNQDNKQLLRDSVAAAGLPVA